MTDDAQSAMAVVMSWRRRQTRDWRSIGREGVGGCRLVTNMKMNACVERLLRAVVVSGSRSVPKMKCSNQNLLAIIQLNPLTARSAF